MKSKEARSRGSHDSYSISPTIVRLLSSSMAAKPGWKCGIPQSPGPLKPGAIVRRSASSSKTEITPREHYSAVARLEEVEVQLAQAETARYTLEHKLQVPSPGVCFLKRNPKDCFFITFTKKRGHRLSHACPNCTLHVRSGFRSSLSPL